MTSNLFTIGKFEFHLRHLLIIGILVISFSTSAMIRSQAVDYGFELNEFDPFFNYRATKYLVENGIDSYVNWHDDMSWYPQGRDVFETSQVALHFTAAFLYQIFGAGSSLYDFTIIFPVVFGSLTTIVIFALVRVIGGTTAGLFASLFFAISPAIIIRGTIGWFKSEPLGLFYGLLALYLFLSGLKSENHKVAFGKLVGGGLFLAIGFASWGGIQFFLMPIGLFIVALPFFRKDHKFLLWAIPVFVVTTVLTSSLFARPGISFLTGIGGFALIGPTIFLVVLTFIRKFSKQENVVRNSLAFLGASILTGFGIISSNILSLPSFRYLNAINPFLTTKDPLVDSVAEHATPTLTQNFFFLSVLLLFAGLGVWLIFRKLANDNTSSIKIKNEMSIFALILGLIGVYAGATFARLELFTSISVIILASIGLSVITSEIMKKETVPKQKSINVKGRIIKISYSVAIIILLLSPTVFPPDTNWISATKAPPTILNGGSNFNMATDDWPASLEWIKNNTSQDAVIASWWDYGYWITTLGERTSLADNATISTDRIVTIAKMFLSSPDKGWEILQQLEADYVVVYVVGQKFVSSDQEFYILGGGGDESKKQWFMRIAGEDQSQFLQNDGFTPTNYFWENTLLGKMFPFTPIAYVDLNTNQQSQIYESGFTAIYDKTIKYENNNDPLQLVYSSPTFNRNDTGVISGVLVYQVNHNYKSESSSSEINSEVEPTGDVATLSTSFGDIVIDFKEDVAPITVENFKKLAQAGFYDGTLFHRIMPGFVIQGGDPNTISGQRDTWGMGDPGYTIPPEFSDLKHKKYVVSMARGSDINSAGSQFFIMLGDASWLDGQYTIFGEVISGKEIVDKIASLETNSEDQPLDVEAARIKKVSIQTIK
ncbi:MAG TPA: peptidylprolyl isomerase [Nitrosopumilaceae archaeon]|nr:peptidylprolyl isomerase [Nitrosopumilaceae archaeon]